MPRKKRKKKKPKRKKRRKKRSSTKKRSKKEQRKIIFLVIDGLADLPINKKTPLSQASKPNLDYLATNGITGELKLVPKKLPVASHIANVALLGYNPSRYYLKRGPLEAVGSNIPYKESDLAIRCNFATVDRELTVLDRRAGRNFLGLDEIARFINQNVKLEVGHIFIRTYGHRAILIIKKHLNDGITDSDPHAPGEKVKFIEPLNPKAKKSAEIVQDFVNGSRQVMEFHPANENRIKHGIPSANYILTRDAGNKLPKLKNFIEKHKLKKAVCISENGVMKGTCMLVGFDSITIPELKFEPTLRFIFDNIVNSVTEYDLIYAHIKGPDEPAHDGNFHKKLEMIETIDKKLEPFKNFKGILIVTCDHITSCKLRAHAYGPVPVLVFGKGKDKTKTFDEFEVKKGELGAISGKKLWRFILG
jgi:2,3-bisphosphoglycerate-independent phosphoglycerate mutase